MSPFFVDVNFSFTSFGRRKRWIMASASQRLKSWLALNILNNFSPWPSQSSIQLNIFWVQIILMHYEIDPARFRMGESGRLQAQNKLDL